ncbi:MAG: hypothetical protein Q9199_005469 [Rusavskia elegans]
MAEYRRLMHAVLHPGLDRFLENNHPNRVKDTRIDLYRYIGYSSVKLRATAILAYRICILERRKLIIFSEWPITQWLVEYFLVNLGFKVLSIRSFHKQRDREAALDQFNDPDDENPILSTSPRVSATSANIQYCCCDSLWVDSFSNTQAVIQSGGRTNRMG